MLCPGDQCCLKYLCHFFSIARCKILIELGDSELNEPQSGKKEKKN